MTQTTNFWIGISLLIFIIPLIFSPLTHDTYGLIKIGATHIFIFVLCMLWMIKLIHRRSAYLHLPVATVCLAIFIVHTSLSLLYAVNPFEGLEQIGIWFNFFVLVVLINVTITNERAVIYLLKTLFITALVAIGYIIWINKGIDLSALRTAYIGSFGHPTFFA